MFKELFLPIKKLDMYRISNLIFYLISFHSCNEICEYSSSYTELWKDLEMNDIMFHVVHLY